MLHAQRGERGTVESLVVNGAKISFSQEGAGDATLVLLHGFAAHRHWWDRVVPLLSPFARIVRMDFSGNGDSDHRDRYSIAIWAEEVVALANSVSGPGPVSFIGHSLGGRVALGAAAHPDSPATAVTVVDTAFPEEGWTSPTTGWKAVQRVYESREAAINRFRLIPDQPLADDLRRQLAEHSVRQFDDGWTWKHDYRLNPGEFAYTPPSRLAVPFAIVYGEHSSVVNAGMAQRMASAVGHSATVTEVPGAHHHLVLDHPQAIADILRALPQHGIASDRG